MRPLVLGAGPVVLAELPQQRRHEAEHPALAEPVTGALVVGECPLDVFQRLGRAVQGVEAVRDRVVRLGAGLPVAQPFGVGQRVERLGQRLGRLPAAGLVLADHRPAAQPRDLVVQAGGQRHALVRQLAPALRVSDQPGGEGDQGVEFDRRAGGLVAGVRQPPFQISQGRHRQHDRLPRRSHRRGRARPERGTP